MCLVLDGQSLSRVRLACDLVCEPIAAGPGLSLAGKVVEFRITLCYRRQGTFGVASTHSPAELLWRTRQRVAQAYSPVELFERTPPVFAPTPLQGLLRRSVRMGSPRTGVV